MQIRTIALLAGFASLFAGLDQANACTPHDTCLDIQYCMSPAGKEFSQPIRDAANKGDGQGIGADTSACQHKYGQPGPSGSWDSVSGGCQASDFAALGKKALGGNPGSCD
jgi:hypothetical protein